MNEMRDRPLIAGDASVSCTRGILSFRLRFVVCFQRR